MILALDKILKSLASGTKPITPGLSQLPRYRYPVTVTPLLARAFNITAQQADTHINHQLARITNQVI